MSSRGWAQIHCLTAVLTGRGGDTDAQRRTMRAHGEKMASASQGGRPWGHQPRHTLGSVCGFFLGWPQQPDCPPRCAPAGRALVASVPEGLVQRACGGQAE